MLEGNEDRPQTAPRNTRTLFEAEESTRGPPRSLLAKRAIQTYLAILEAAGVEFEISAIGNLLMARDFWS